MNIITCNYDTQLEKSYEGFCTIPETIFEKFTQSKNIIRLNGSCSYPYKIETRYLGHTEFSMSFLESVIQLYDKFMNTLEPKSLPYISFAWGKNVIEDKVIETLKETKKIKYLLEVGKFIFQDWLHYYFLRKVNKGAFWIKPTNRNSVKQIFTIC